MAEHEKRLQRLFAGLDSEGRQMLLEFAEFLASRHGARAEAPAPVPIARPENETVVAAIQRLSQTYPMLDKRKILNQASALMAQHVMAGREALEVIDELEVIFERHYRAAKGRGDES